MRKESKREKERERPSVPAPLTPNDWGPQPLLKQIIIFIFIIINIIVIIVCIIIINIIIITIFILSISVSSPGATQACSPSARQTYQPSHWSVDILQNKHHNIHINHHPGVLISYKANLTKHMNIEHHNILSTII